MFTQFIENSKGFYNFFKFLFKSFVTIQSGIKR